MAHSLIIGQTESGKTTLAKRLCSKIKPDFNTLVLDPLRDPFWDCDFITDNVHLFLTVAKNNQSCFLFIDESGVNLGQYDNCNFWLATQSRHWGHSSVFIAQRCQMVAPTVRNQTSFLFMFNSSFDDSRLLANEFNNKELLNAHTLKQGEYYKVSRFGRCEKFRLF